MNLAYILVRFVFENAVALPVQTGSDSATKSKIVAHAPVGRMLAEPSMRGRRRGRVGQRF